MSQISLDIPHTQNKEEVVRRVKTEIEKLRPSVAKLEDRWDGDILSFGCEVMGMKISGTLEILDTLLRIKVDLPMAALMFRGTIEKRIRAEVGGLLT